MGNILPQFDDTIVISTSRLTKVYGRLVAVNDLHLQVMRGDVFGFLGPNGSGKTTTIRMLLGLIRPTAGRAVLFGMDNTYQLSAILQRIGAIVETPVFYPYLSGLDNLRVIASGSGMMSGKSNDRRLEEVLEIVELREYAKLTYSKYSLGMKQRLGIAAALLTDPELVLLDEPTNGLDPSGMIEIRKLIQRLAALGKTIFLSSHMLHEVQHVCNRVAILHRGNLIKQGNVEEMLREQERVEVRLNEDEETHYAQHILQLARDNGASWLVDAKVEQDSRGKTTLLVEAPAERSAEINAMLARNKLFAAEIHPHQGSLEDLFLQAMAESPMAQTQTQTQEHVGMEALAQGWTEFEQEEKAPEAPGGGKRGRK